MSPRGGVGIVGAGRVAELHAAALRELGIDLLGVVASTPARSEEAARRLGAERGFPDLDALLDDPRIEAVHVATPTHLHVEQVERVLDRGRHVLCEKPLTATAAQSAALVERAREAGVVGAVGYAYRYQPGARELRARARGLGSPLLVRAAFRQDWLLHAPAAEWRLDATRSGPSRALAAVGGHRVDLVEFVTRDRIVAVSAATRGVVPAARAGGDRQGPAAPDDIAVVAFELAGGGVGTLGVSQVAAGHGNTLELELSGTIDGLALPRIDMGSDYLGACAALVRDMRRAIDGGAAADLPTFRACLRTHVVRDAILASALERRWVEVPAGDDWPAGAAPGAAAASRIPAVAR